METSFVNIMSRDSLLAWCPPDMKASTCASWKTTKRFKLGGDRRLSLSDRTKSLWSHACGMVQQSKQEICHRALGGAIFDVGVMNEIICIESGSGSVFKIVVRGSRCIQICCIQSSVCVCV